jgi:phage terminase large subunit GpA-like protein
VDRARRIAALERKHPLGGSLKIDATAIDSGDGEWTDRVYNFCFPRASRRVMAIKGVSGTRPSIAVSHGKVKGGRLWVVGVDTVKTTLFSRLSRGASIRFSKSLEPAYYEQLSSERRIVRYSRGRPIRRFERIVGRRGEALDCLVYATAARSAAPIQLDQRADDLRHEAVPVAKPSVIRSRFMEG